VPVGSPPVSAGSRCPPTGRRRPWIRGGQAKEALGVAGVITIVVAAGISLGFASTSNDPLSIVDVAAAQDPDTLGGLTGLAPGGPAVVVRLPVTNPGDRPLTLTGVTPQLSLLPSTCPATAWLFTPVTELPVLPAGTAAEVSLSVALVADAPASCQAVAASLPAVVRATAGGAATSIDSTVTVATGRLGSPGAVISVEGGAVRVRATAPSAGPQPSGYTVDAVDPDGRHSTVCARPTLDVCVDGAAPGAVRRGYVVTAHLGSNWRRDSVAVEVWTPPPAPSLALPSRSAAEQELTVTAPPAGGAYQVTITVDGVQVARLPVPEDVALARTVRLHGLGPGPHRAVARAGSHDVSAESAPLILGAMNPARG
jgi:hypothetical protein